jgi:hypothetical protein
MKDDDDDILNAAVPEPDTEPSHGERAHAKAFAELVDKTLASGRMPPAMSSDDRALLEVATVIRAASGGLELPAERQQVLVEDALRQAVGASPSTSLTSTAPDNVVPLRRRWMPWAIAGVSSMVAAAAIVMLVVRKPVTVTAPAPAAAASIPMNWTSRPADPLIGQIDDRCRNQDALECARSATVRTSSRIDQIFADRLEGYRERRLAGGKP